MIAVLLVNPLRDPAVVILALLAGGAAGVVVAMRTKMIQMPAMIAFQHGMGGIAAFAGVTFNLLSRYFDPTIFLGQELDVIAGIILGGASLS